MRTLDRNSKSGYTLLEVMIVLALFAILLSIAIPSTNLIAKARENDELNRFRRDLLYIRTNAIVENSTYRLTLDLDKNTYMIYRLSPIGKEAEKIKTVHLNEGLVLQKSSSIKQIYFKPTGAPSIGTTIYLVNRKGQEVEISIAPATGSINIKIDKTIKNN